jgi:hypothetical protein
MPDVQHSSEWSAWARMRHARHSAQHSGMVGGLQVMDDLAKAGDGHLRQPLTARALQQLVDGVVQDRRAVAQKDLRHRTEACPA